MHTYSCLYCGSTVFFFLSVFPPEPCPHSLHTIPVSFPAPAWVSICSSLCAFPPSLAPFIVGGFPPPRVLLYSSVFKILTYLPWLHQCPDYRCIHHAWLQLSAQPKVILQPFVTSIHIHIFNFYFLYLILLPKPTDRTEHLQQILWFFFYLQVNTGVSSLSCGQNYITHTSLILSLYIIL